MANPFESTLSKLGGTASGVGGAIGSAYDKLAGISYVKQDPQALKNENVSRMMASIANNETGGVKTDPYAFSQPGGADAKYGTDIGKYQVNSKELASWSKQFLGETISPDEFQKSPELQDAYMKARVGTLYDAGASNDEILALHRGGLTGYADAAVRQKKVQQRQQYVDKGLSFLKNMDNTKDSQLATNQ